MRQNSLAENIEFCRSADLPGVDILRADNTCQRFRVLHQTYSINTPLRFDGTAQDYQYSYRGKTHTGHLEESMILEPGEVHNTIKLEGPVSFRVVLLPPAFVERCAREMGLSSRPHFHRTISDDIVLYKGFKNLHRSLETPCTSLERQSRLFYCLRRLLRVAGENKPSERTTGLEKKAIRRAVQILRENWEENITLEHLAESVGLSRFHLLRTFKQEIGVPPHAYQILLRVAWVKKFLRMGITPHQAAVDAGFADQSHMIRHFKESVGVSPGKFTRAVNI